MAAASTRHIEPLLRTALIVHRNPAINIADPALLMRVFRHKILQHGRIFVPDLWFEPKVKPAINFIDPAVV